MASLKSTISKYYAFVFLHNFALFSAVLVPFFTDWGGLTLFQVQILQSWFMFWIFLLEVPTGAVADHLGRKYSIGLGALIFAFATLLYGSIPYFESFLIAEFMMALGYALMSGADKALLYDALKDAGREKDSQKIFGKSHAILLISMGIAAPIGSLLASSYGLNAPILFSAIPIVLASVVAFTIDEPKRHDKKSESKHYLEVVKSGFIFFYQHKSLRILAIDGVLVSSATYFVFWFYQPLLQSIKFPIFYFGIIQTMMLTSEVLVAGNFTFLERVFGSAKSYLKFSAFITTLAIFTVAVFPNVVTIMLFIILAGGFGVTRLELMISHMQKFIPSEKRATVLSSVSMFRRLALVFVNPAVGFIATFSLSAALFTVSLLPLAVFLFSPIKKEMLD